MVSLHSLHLCYSHKKYFLSILAHRFNKWGKSRGAWKGINAPKRANGEINTEPQERMISAHEPHKD
ncbi:small acid-soluble spore protein K [Caldalkalibacillus thermarum]